jgi:hypothetical protein
MVAIGRQTAAQYGRILPADCLIAAEKITLWRRNYRTNAQSYAGSQNVQGR